MTVSPPSEELPSGGSAAASDASRVPAVERAFAALAFLRDHGPATLTEIVADTNYDGQVTALGETVHRSAAIWSTADGADPVKSWSQ